MWLFGHPYGDNDTHWSKGTSMKNLMDSIEHTLNKLQAPGVSVIITKCQLSLLQSSPLTFYDEL